ncbi:sugar ABC transporter ATP-binding protein [Paraburkholderia tuberum]|uniref:Monosaccharide ABC transporter ATP-binding protein, CUT2 family n=1 Tax=Paraburkholderia tuberum TaxID=157910 RepID=A0A1H1KGH0_9BURK|nr:sugar ABC transporter ATP-binding protein [Paraburkholderia tuberum]SDR61423.1 monosaccharide ABC transporter ATP-binding protein, CUT2 family [Paraburkholderia tuberum]
MNAILRSASVRYRRDVPKGTPILVAKGIGKSFPGVVALDNVDFEIRAGEVNALVGENGAGKSTLIKMMAGFHAPDEGEIRVDGELLTPSPQAAHAAGVATIHQDHHLVPNMTVAENIMLGRWPSRFGVISRREQMARAEAVLARVVPNLSPTTLARQLTPAEGQLVEIARAISEDSRVLVMDEPTTSLSPPEIERLFQVVDDLKAQGLGVVFVSHWLEEVFRISDRITVLRDGRLVSSIPASELDHAKVIKMMVGRDVQQVKYSPRQAGEVVLHVDGLSRAGVLEDISFSVRAGEIVTLAGLVGAGRTEVANCIAGIDRYDEGAISIDGKLVAAGDPKKAIKAGIALVPEDRREQALVPKLSVSTNITMPLLDRIAPRGVISESREAEIVNEAARSLSIKMASASVPISTLSGGNQQKAVIGRCVALGPRLLILDEPTKGVDVGAKAEISEIIIRLASQGAAVLLISSELPEVLALSDRALVMRSGRIAGQLTRDELSQESVMNLATMG